ncbi:MAG TPA: amidohydrolase family protein, partial [Cyclobacteriaceae bacterium]|nr:amidohydrolase family protein [Cyclobacteriaceae bacterium]
IKVYSHITRAHFDIIIRKAKENHLPVTGHLGTLSARYAVENGINGLEHGLFAINDFGVDSNDYTTMLCRIARIDLASEQVSKLIDLIVEKNVYVDPTMVIMEMSASDFEPNPIDYESYLNEDAKKIQVVMDKYVSDLVSKDNCLEEALTKQRQFVKLVYDRKGLLVAGTDPGTAKVLPGFGIKKEIEFFMLSGIPLVEAIKIASYNGAFVLGISNKTGSIETGKNADLSIYNGDITEHTDVLKKPELVLKHGKIYYPDSLLMRVKGKVTSVKPGN